MKNVMITGTSSGLGWGLAQVLGERGWRVYGCSRRGCDLPVVRDQRCDLADPAAVAPALGQLLTGVSDLALVVLNAGILGRIQDLADTSLEELKTVMDTNLWANKSVMDALLMQGIRLGQVVMISSGAAVLGNRGWGGYALSKAALNMLARLYAREMPDSHISALAPGIIDTAMMNHLCDEADAEAFPALERLRAARGTEAMPDPVSAAERVVSVLEALRERPSGSFIDIREIMDPEGYRGLYGGRGACG